MRKLADWFVSAISLLLISRIVPGIHFSDFTSAIFAALIIGLINVLIKPLLVILTLPITILTLGLFSLVINGLVFQLASRITPGFMIDTLWAAIIGSILYSVVNSLLHKLTNLS